MRYRDLLGARKDLLQEGRLVPPSLAAALAKTEIALSDLFKQVAEHHATHEHSDSI